MDKILLSLALTASLWLSLPANAISLQPGAVVLTGGMNPGDLVQVDLGTSSKTVVFNNPLLHYTGVAVSDDRETIYFSHHDTTGNSVEALDVATGATSTLLDGQNGDLFLDADANVLYVAGNGVMAINLDTWTSRPLGGLGLTTPIDLWQEPSGTLAVLADGWSAIVFRLDPSIGPYGSVSIISEGLGLGSTPQGTLAVDPVTGTIYQAGNSFSRFLSIDPVTGAQTSIANYPAGDTDMVWDAERNGLLIIQNVHFSETGFRGWLVSIDPVTRVQTIVYDEFLGQSLGDRVYGHLALVPLPEPSTLACLISGTLMIAIRARRNQRRLRCSTGFVPQGDGSQETFDPRQTADWRLVR